jgi:hypothetical protein
MPQCPTCQAQVKPDERFCGNCGARLTPQTPPADAAPARPAGNPTVVLSPADFGAAPPPEQPSRPSTDATILAGSTPPPSAGGYTPPPTYPTTPAAPPPVGMYPNATLPSGAGATPAPQKSGSNIWKIVGIIAGIGLLACIALSAGAYLLVRRAANEGQNALATVNAGLSTAAADPTLQAISSDLPTAIAAAEATAAPSNGNSGGGALLYKQTFDKASADFDEDESENASYKFVDGTYSVSAKKPNMIIWRKIKGDYGNTAISLDATIDGPKESAAGLVFHYQDDKNFYLFTITADGRYALDMYKDDNLTTLIDWTESSAIKTSGETNTIRVETVGDKIRLYANDELLDEVSDGTFKRGKAAIAINTFDDPKLTVRFDNLTVKSIK